MGKRTIRVLSLMALMVGGSGVVRAAEIQRSTFQGSQVLAGFFGSASITCTDGVSTGFVSAFGSLQGAEQIFTSTGAPPFMSNGVLVQIDSYSNSCTGQILGGMSGGIPNALTPPDKKLSSAAMVGSALVQDFFSGVQIPVSIDVDVIGSGQTSQSKGHNKTKIKGATGGPIIVSTDRSANGNRGATPEGTIIIDGVDIAAEFSFGLLISNSSATQTISK
jgi:hypothetical protein